jgi:hypothetical protein
MPEDGKKPLLYISSKKKASMYVYDYKKGKLLYAIIGFYAPEGLCADANGNVWITDTDPSTGDGYLEEYPHRGKRAIVTLDDPNDSPQACAVDPTTGNLAVANLNDDIAIYPAAQEPPTYYSTAGLVHKPNSITYDDMGNAYFANGHGEPAWLPAGSSSVTKYYLKPRVTKHGPLGWDGQYLTVLAHGNGYDQVWRYMVREKGGKRKARVELDCCMSDYVIYQSTLASTEPELLEASVSRYPAGGRAFLGIALPYPPTGIAVSAPPSK